MNESHRYQPYPRAGSSMPGPYDRGIARSSHAPSRSGSLSSFDSPLPESGFELPSFDDFSSQLPSVNQSSFSGPSFNSWQPRHLEDDGPEAFYRDSGREHASAADVERVAGQLGIGSAQLLQFNGLSNPIKLVQIYGLLVRQQQEAAAMHTSLANIISKVDETSESIAKDFKPSTGAIKNMRKMTRHYLLQPVRSYYKIHEYLKDYYATREEENHPLETTLYPSNVKVKNIINRLLKEFASQARANMRKVIWKFVKDRTELVSWATFMMDHYWMGGQPAEVPKMLLARLALMRQVALPLVDQPSVRGQDTNFWKLLNKELTSLHARLGDPKASAEQWKTWAKEITKKDQDTFKEVPIGEMPAPDNDEDAELDS